MEWLLQLNFLVILVILATICVSDVRHRIIGNKSVVILCIAIFSMTFIGGRVPNVPLALAVLAVGFILFISKLIGAGDVKMVAALALFFSWNEFHRFLFITVLLGGVLALIGLVFFNKNTKTHGLPYAVAISLGFIISSYT